MGVVKQCLLYICTYVVAPFLRFHPLVPRNCMSGGLSRGGGCGGGGYCNDFRNFSHTGG